MKVKSCRTCARCIDAVDLIGFCRRKQRLVRLFGQCRFYRPRRQALAEKAYDAFAVA